ncbi:MAG: methyltransferase domain-containing protein [Chloroflexota bacterium]
MRYTPRYVNTTRHTVIETASATWYAPPRKDAPELLDMGYGTPEDVRRSMADLWRVNVLLGGIWSITRHLYPRIRQRSGPVTVLDIGAGNAEIAGVIATWAARHHLNVTVIPLDYAARHLQQAQRQNNMPPLQADALRLPFATASVDFVMSSLFLHHFTPPQVQHIFHESYRIARCAVIMSDLLRGTFNELAWHVARPVFARSHITYHDGLRSVQRAYLPREFTQMAEAAGLAGARVHTPLPWRMTLVVDK